MFHKIAALFKRAAAPLREDAEVTSAVIRAPEAPVVIDLYCARCGHPASAHQSAGCTMCGCAAYVRS